MENEYTHSSVHKAPGKKRGKIFFVAHTFIISITVILIILLTAYFFYGFQQKRAARIKHAEIEGIGNLKEDQVSSWLKERTDDADYYFNNHDFALKTFAFAAAPLNTVLLNNISNELATFRKNHQYENIFLISSKGEVLADIKETGYPSNTFSWDASMDTIHSLHFRDFFLNPQTGKPNLGFWIPYFKNKEDKHWTTLLVIRINPGKLLYPLLATWPNKSLTSETTLARKEGDSVVYLNNLRFKPNSALHFKLPLSRSDLPAAQAVNGNTGTWEGIDYRGMPVLADMRKVKNTPWYMVNKIDLSEVYSDLDQTFILVVLWVIGLIIIFVVVMIIRWRSIRMKNLTDIYRNEIRAMESEKALETLTQKQNALLKVLPDLVWIKDIKGIYKEVNTVFCDTFGLREDEIVGKSDLDLWDAKEAERARSSDRQVIDALSPRRFLYSIINRHGDELWMDAVKSLIYNDSGEIIGLIGVARDITVQVEKEDEIKNLNRIYATLSEINQAVVRVKDKDKLFTDVCRIAVEHGEFCLAWLAKETSTAGLPVALGIEGTMEAHAREIARNYVSVKMLNSEIQTLLKRGDYYICNDIDAESGDVFSTGKSGDVGFASYAIFPLIVNDVMFANLVLYSEKKGCFNAKELQLLTELSGDISFAIGYTEQEELRREAVDKFQLSFMNAPMGISLTSTDGRFIQVNDAFSSMLGYSHDDLMEIPFASITYPDDRKKSLEWMAQMISGALTGLNAAEKRYITKSGSYIWVEITTSMMFDKEGKPLYFITMVQDITEKKKNAETLRQSTEMLQLAQRIARIGSWTYDYMSGEYDLSEEMCDITGLNRDASSPVEDKYLTTFVPENQNDFRDLLSKAVEKSGEFKEVISLVMPGGVARHIQVQGMPLRDDTGVAVKFFGAVQDISDRVRIEEEASMERDQLKMIMNSFPYGVYIVNKEYEIEYVNPMITKEYGVVGTKKCYEYLHGGNRPCIWCRNKEVFEGKSFTWEWTSERNGKTFEVFDTLFKNLDGSLSKLEIFFDITQRKRAENEIISLNQELEYRVDDRTTELVAYTKELEAFSYSVSHDLRAPLRAIHGFGNALIEDYGDQLDETAMGYLQRMSKGVERMSGLIDDLLNLSMITRKEVHFEEIDISNMALDVVETLGFSGNAQIEVAEKMSIYGDKGLVRIAMENLIGNAYKYSSKDNVAEIKIGVYTKDGREYISVKDNGVGFDMEYAHKLFTPFQRLHSDAEFKGTGIGLAIVQRIINKHGGEIWAESKIGSGSTFYFRFSDSKPNYS
ncbi:MAG: PAS domain S-box protein [Bacteroidota bacterium]